MIIIKESKTADTRTCGVKTVSKDTLLKSTYQHLNDIKQGLDFFKLMLDDSIKHHDHDKLSNIDGFYHDFQTNFTETTWWDNHRKVNRHHLTQDDGIPQDVNLIDVLDFINDCVMAGMGRTGEVYPLHLSPELLEKAFQNTITLLKSQIIVDHS